MHYCEHTPITGHFIYIVSFIAAVALLWGWMYCQLIVKQNGLKLAACKKVLLYFSLAMVSVSLSFYFLFRCISHNGNIGYMLGIEHELRTSDFGLSGILWFVSMLFLIHSVKTLAQVEFPQVKKAGGNEEDSSQC